MVLRIFALAQRFINDYNFLFFNRNELLTTETLEKAIARPAKIGFKVMPQMG
jgi:hypothetical protein